MKIPEVGQPVSFFNIEDTKGKIISPNSLLGQPYILYFYPQDDTPHCTKEACDLRDHKEQLDKFNAFVIGVSPDSTASHDEFISKYALNFSLVSDPNHELCSLFDVWKEEDSSEGKKGKIIRATFVIDAQGIIRWIEKPVQVEGHISRIIEALQNLSNN